MVPRMRVLMLAWEFPPRSVGGIAAHVDGLCQALARAGNDVVLLTLSHPGAPADTTVGGVRVLRARTDLPWLPDDDLVARVASANHHLVQLVTRLERGWTPDIVHAHDWQVAWAADTLSALFGARLIASFHSTYLTNWPYQMAAAVVAIAPVLLVFAFTQRFLTQGLHFTGIKG